MQTQARSDIERHVDECPSCRALMAAAGRVCASAVEGSVELAPDDSLGVDLLALAQLVQAPLGRYRVLDVVGGGGMGVVLSAWDDVLQRRVAIKALRRAGDRGQSAEIMRHEAKALAALRDPRVVNIFDVVEQGGRLFLVMELIAGQTLRVWQVGRAVEEILGAYTAVAHGLVAVHGAGLIHCDVKADNVLVADDGRILLADFGFAVVLEGAGQRGAAIGGTPRYMAPEQRAGEPVTPATDQYSLCVSLWEALGGEVPPTRAASIPWRVRRVLRRGLRTQAGQRWPSVRALAVALSRPTRWRWVAGAVVIACVIAAGLVLALPDPTTTGAGAGAPLDGTLAAERASADEAGAVLVDGAIAQATAHRVEGQLVRAQRVLADTPVETLGLAARTRLGLARVRALDRLGRRADALQRLTELETTSALAPDLVRAEVALEIARLGPIRVAATDRHQWLEMARVGLRRAGADPDRDLRVRVVTADLAEREGRHEAAVAHYQAAADLVGDATPALDQVEMLLGYGGTLRRLGRHDDADRVLQRAEALVTEHGLGRSDAALAVSIARAHQVADAGDHDAGITMLHRALADAEAIDGVDPHVLAAALSSQGAYYLEENRLKDALRVLSRAEALMPEYYAVLANLATYWSKIPCGDVVDPERCKDDALERSHAYEVRAYEQTRLEYGDAHPTVAQLGGNLMHGCLQRGELEQADKYADDTLTNLDRAYGPTHMRLLRPLLHTLELRVRQRDRVRAPQIAARIERVVVANNDALGAAAQGVVKYALARVRIWANAARKDDAEQLRASLAAFGPSPPVDIELIDTWFAGTYLLQGSAAKAPPR